MNHDMIRAVNLTGGLRCPPAMLSGSLVTWRFDKARQMPSATAKPSASPLSDSRSSTADLSQPCPSTPSFNSRVPMPKVITMLEVLAYIVAAWALLLFIAVIFGTLAKRR